MNEIWKDIKDYEGLYQVSNLGRVKSLERLTTWQDRGRRIMPQRIMSLEVTRQGYLRIMLAKEGTRTRFQVHRLVAAAFIQNPNNLPFINHKDEEKANNVVENLEWCTSQYNNTYNDRAIKANEWRRRKIIQYKLNGEYVATWESISKAARETKTNASNICECVNGNRNKTRNGFMWKPAEVI